MAQPDYTLEHALGQMVAGIDEAGRGPWVGPVVAGCVLLDASNLPSGINDSKKLTASKREELYEQIMTSHHVGVGLASVDEIDTLNILQATKLAMRRAFDAMGQAVDGALVDGNQMLDLPCRVQTVVKGDSKSLSIAAASIVAKVYRDRLMCELAKEFPYYGWERNAGYGTKQHQEAMAVHGITPHHRKSFKPIKVYIEEAA